MSTFPSSILQHHRTIDACDVWLPRKLFVDKLTFLASWCAQDLFEVESLDLVAKSFSLRSTACAWKLKPPSFACHSFNASAPTQSPTYAQAVCVCLGVTLASKGTNGNM